MSLSNGESCGEYGRGLPRDLPRSSLNPVFLTVLTLLITL